MPRADKGLFALYVNSQSSRPQTEAREILAWGLKSLGVRTTLRDEQEGFAAEADWHVVVAPHEFFTLGCGMALRSEKWPERVVLFNTEPFYSHWYPLVKKLFPRARAVWDADYETARALKMDGGPGEHVPLGFAPGCPLFQPARKQALEEAAMFLGNRPLDVFFSGELTPRRDRFFARAAPLLSNYRSHLHFEDNRRPARPGEPGGLSTTALLELSRRSKIMLNIHRFQARTCDALRVGAHGLAQGALVLSEPLGETGRLKLGAGIVEATLEEFPERLRYHLSNRRGQAEARRSAGRGHENFLKNCGPSVWLAPALENLQRSQPATPLAAPPRAASPSAAWEEVCAHQRPGPAPSATVAISLHNYRRFVVECLESVRAQTLRRFDLIVSDDASTDGSAEEVRRWLKRRGGRFARALLLRSNRNAGLAAARNAAFTRARTGSVFVLDADNVLYPPCLERLSEALAASRADFAHSYLRRFNDEERLMNLRCWNTDLLRRSDYLDAMALVRRAAWKAVGGYQAQSAQGWEDFDFWLRQAKAGRRGVLVPEILACYRVHMRSMVHTESVPNEWSLKPEFRALYATDFESRDESQVELALKLFGTTRLPLRREEPAPGKAKASGHYLVAALAALRDLNADLLSSNGRK